MPFIRISSLLLGVTVGALACSPASDQSGASAGTATQADSLGSDPVGLALSVADSALRAHLKSLAPRLASDTTHVFSPRRDSASAPMVGAPIGEAAERFFARHFGNAMSRSADVFAVAWLPLSPAYEVFLLRTPSQYDVSAMTLWAYNTADRVWSQPLEIADAFGDAGWSFQKDAWIQVQPGSGEVTVVVRRVDEDMDLESDDPVTRVGPDSLYSISLRGWLGGGFARQVLPDTLRSRYPLRKHRDAAG